MPEPFTTTMVSVTVVSVAVCVYKSIDRMVSAPKELVRQGGESTEEVIRALGSEFRKLFGSEPRISINRTVIQRGGEAIRELALYKESIVIDEEWIDTRWKSTKRLQIQQPFTLKAGFDLNRLKLEVDPVNDLVTVTVSDSTIVNVEYAGDYTVLREENGLWNRITTEERDGMLNSLPLKAREEAAKLGLREKAAEQLQVFLRRIVPPRFELVIECADDTLYFQEQEILASVPETALSVLGLEEESVRIPARDRMEVTSSD